MKLFYWSLNLGMLAYIIGGVFRRSESLAGERLLIVLLVIVPAVIGTVLGGMSFWRREVKAWWAIAVIVLNLTMGFTGMLLLSPE